MAPGSIVVLHACCHNPTGVDLEQDHWKSVLEVVRARGLVPFLDLRLPGLRRWHRRRRVRCAAVRVVDDTVFLSSSFSKSVSLYGERIGALSVVAGSSDEAKRVLSQVKRVIRTNYSNPPTHGGELVARILSTPDLRALWEKEVGGMRDRIKEMRHLLVEGIKKRAPQRDFSFILKQRGMFSYSGLTKDQVGRLRTEYSIYAVDSGRICVAALNRKNIDYVADAIAHVI
jgi:aromatic-amino-acid transaminase